MRQLMAAKRLNLAILASGRGSNFTAISEAISENKLNAQIKVLISDKAEALALEKARDLNIKAIHINLRNYASMADYETELVKRLKEFDIDMVVLAGYMRLVGTTFLQAFQNRIVNIHPSLLPAFKGLNAQKQALDYGVKYSGCTVHLVDEGMDTGPIIMQSVVPIYNDDTEESLTARILEEEHKIYWQSLQFIAAGQLYIRDRQVFILEK
ncbi:MAG: phosphoribosylglycinamide formyltransferase [Syntrophomonadaceae bacterium]|nr:phosphoribosylglycinamide formyltransferase [Syntrophomonadaceae bacterium]